MNIEIGKFYKTRSGKKAGPMVQVSRAFPWQGWVDGDLHSWTIAGSYVLEGAHAFDLVCEWTLHDDVTAAIDTGSIDGLTDMYADERSEITAIGGPYSLHPKPAPIATGYGDLHAILQDAFDQSASGKGRERHANDKPFDRQPIMEIGRMVGPGYAIGQAMKKLQEAMTMQTRQQFDPADRELLGAIVYAAAAVKLIRENRAA